jgi:16S rRNA (adenine1518-N6/adenine1519-N6)-dimethyltransferase
VTNLNASDVRRIFKERGLAPKKWLGQNLLVDPHALENIVRSAAVDAGAPIVEVGAGLGVLTEALAARAARVWALEVDAGFTRVLQERFASVQGVTIIHADALKYDFRTLAREVGKLRVVANLPYSISSRLIFRFFENRDIFSSLHILLQQEVADRLVAPPSTREYGILSVLLAVSATVEILFDIPPRAFFPVPEVVSSLVRISFPDPPPLDVSDSLLLIRLVKASFAGRRKTLRNTLLKAKIPGASPETIERAAAALGIDMGRRGETLSPDEFCRLANTLTNYHVA